MAEMGRPGLRVPFHRRYYRRRGRLARWPRARSIRHRIASLLPTGLRTYSFALAHALRGYSGRGDSGYDSFAHLRARQSGTNSSTEPGEYFECCEGLSDLTERAGSHLFHPLPLSIHRLPDSSPPRGNRRRSYGRAGRDYWRLPARLQRLFRHRFCDGLDVDPAQRHRMVGLQRAGVDGCRRIAIVGRGALFARQAEEITWSLHVALRRPERMKSAPRSNDYSRYGAVTTIVVTTWLFSA